MALLPVSEVPVVLARCGVAPDADEPALLAELAARGWVAQVEDPSAGTPTPGGRAGKWRAVAFRVASPAAAAGALGHEHRRATGPSAAEALRRLLASALVRDS